ncbi:MAG: 50S ribosomal protein L32 [Candidatus Uhrbacteria bacterium GW2011_GWF2_39_13]|uniref:Large ribosomal subunit protein bL32 n=1 Tax=Candidatus Uhrbacteria bacterium GW2011_GWF2_39_13 TaxID=1618995 RepID=A0A0G0Q194_9BACT|nr:MAG: 50S ribosomal protein L32 [Candidatus Uhrbacteria bacterium GW2011_GWF2_39_13]HAU66643.1 50S ribosomal protein L32 [Candidatus Uhrbacteria bacterium]
MPVPARKKSRSAVRRRRSHDHLTAQTIGLCQTCQAPLQQHRACKSCGMYKGHSVLDVSRQTRRTIKKAKTAPVHDDHTHDKDVVSAKPTLPKPKKKKAS